MNRSLQSLLVSLGCLAIAAYFGHHAVSGKYGLKAQAKLLDQHALVQRRIAGLEAEYRRLERDIAALNQTPPDRDLVEAIAQTTLGFAYPGDRIILLKSPLNETPDRP